MPARLLFEIAIRVLGLWSAVVAASSLAGVVCYLYPGMSGSLGPGSIPDVIIAYGVPICVQGLLGIMLIWRGPWLAARFYPANSGDAQIQLNVGSGDVHRIACCVLGIYFLVHAAEPGSRFVVDLIQKTWPSDTTVINGVVAAAYTAAGVLLVFGARHLGQLLSNLRYDPDTIPRQQISLAVLLGMILAVGVILGAIRWMVLD